MKAAWKVSKFVQVFLGEHGKKDEDEDVEVWGNSDSNLVKYAKILQHVSADHPPCNLSNHEVIARLGPNWCFEKRIVSFWGFEPSPFNMNQWMIWPDEIHAFLGWKTTCSRHVRGLLSNGQCVLQGCQGRWVNVTGGCFVSSMANDLDGKKWRKWHSWRHFGGDVKEIS